MLNWWKLCLLNFLVYLCNCTIRNIAQQKLANQSTSYPENSAFKAVDGYYGTCSHTAGSFLRDPESSPWWEVDLQLEYFIHSVEVFHTDKDHPPLPHNFSIEVYGYRKTIDRAILCYYQEGQATSGTSELYLCKTVVKAQYVRITINGKTGDSNTLILCEVRVYGFEDESKSSFQRFQGAELSDAPDMTYSVQGYGQCAMKCYVLPMCHIFSVKSMSTYYQCNIFNKENITIVSQSIRYSDMIIFAL